MEINVYMVNKTVLQWYCFVYCINFIKRNEKIMGIISVIAGIATVILLYCSIIITNLKGFEKGKREKKRAKQKVIFKRCAIAAGIIVVGTTMAGVINPELVSAIPIVGDVFEYFNYGLYKQASDKYEELGKDVNLTIEDNDVKVILNKVIIDDNILVASLLVESDKFIGYDEWRSPQDFLNTDIHSTVDNSYN